MGKIISFRNISSFYHQVPRHGTRKKDSYQNYCFKIRGNISFCFTEGFQNRQVHERWESYFRIHCTLPSTPPSALVTVYTFPSAPPGRPWEILHAPSGVLEHTCDTLHAQFGAAERPSDILHAPFGAPGRRCDILHTPFGAPGHTSDILHAPFGVPGRP